MGKSNIVTDLMNPKMLVKSLNPAEIFSASGWTGRKSLYSKLLDPAGLYFTKSGAQPPKVPPTVDEQAAAARDLERRRLSIGAGSRAAAIGGSVSANLGKSTLGGSY